MNKVLFGCCFDNGNPLFPKQVLRLSKSINKYANKFIDGTLMACHTCDIDNDFFKDQNNLILRKVDPFNSLSSPSNKLRFLEQPEIQEYDYIVFMDCDIIIVGDINPYLKRNSISGKIVDMMYSSSREYFEDLLKSIGIEYPQEKYTSTVSKHPCIMYCNGGFIILSSDVIPEFSNLWIDMTNHVLNNLNLIHGPNQWFHEQVSLSLSYYKHSNIEFNELHEDMNFPLNLKNLEGNPSVIHYHEEHNIDKILDIYGDILDA